MMIKTFICVFSKVFAIIRVVALRMYFKQTNSGLFTFPLKWYRIMIILPMKNWDNEKSYVVTLYAVLKDDKKVGPTIASFVDSLGSSVEDFKFVRMKGKTSVTLDLGK